MKRPKEDRVRQYRLLSVVAVMLAGALWATEAATKSASLTFPNGKRIRVDLALTPQQQEIGLMFRTSLPKDYGMLFVFPSEQRLQFWMKNTWTDLDMIFIDKEKRITAVFRNVPRSFPETPESAVARRGADGQFVLELPAGTSVKLRLKAGDLLRFDVSSQQQGSSTRGGVDKK